MFVVANVCRIYSVSRNRSLLWKWRYTGADGSDHVCEEDYTLFSDCAAAARASGYEPRADWTGPCALIITQGRKAKAALVG
jgi:hypothetical protein